MISIKKSKFIKSLKIKKYRSLERCFLVEGRKNVGEVLKSKFKVSTVIGTTRYFETQPEELIGFEGELLESDEKFLVEAGTFQSNHDCLAVVEMKDSGISSLDLGRHVFLLDGISDPGNLGTIIRTLDWFGFNQLVCSEDSTDLYNPKVINSSMGSFCRVEVFYTDLKLLIEKHPRLVIGADMSGQSIAGFRPSEHSFILMGNESHGIRNPLRNLVTKMVCIPRIGGAESLNVGIATAIFAHEFIQT